MLLGPARSLQGTLSRDFEISPDAGALADHRCACAGVRAALRAGYMGHITTLANKLMAMEDERGLVSEALQGSQQWVQWRDTVLRPRNAFEDLNRWACGRPSTQEMASRAASQESPMSEVRRDLICVAVWPPVPSTASS